MVNRIKSDILVIGGGIIGLCMARNLADKGSVVLIDKDHCGAHTSGRNSGVLHAGIYYTPGSSKAKFSVQGNKALSQYCLANGVGYHKLGKIIAPNSDKQLKVIDQLLERAKKNGAPVQKIDYKQARQIEPRIVEQQYYLWSPSTAIADNKGLIQALKRECEQKGVKILEGWQYIDKIKTHPNYTYIQTNKEKIQTQFVVNCGGLYADKIAHRFGFGLKYQVLPFVGRYLDCKPDGQKFNTLVYPCPVGGGMFLGAHTTNKFNGSNSLGPSASPALWREQYRHFSNFSLIESAESISRYVGCILSPEWLLYCKLLAHEVKKYTKKAIIKDCSKIVKGLTLDEYSTWGEAAVFPQLVDVRTHKFIQDFYYEGNNKSFHFLNIVSPGWTSAFALTEHVTSNILKI